MFCKRLSVFFVLVLVACGHSVNQSADDPYKHLSSYNFTPESAVTDRIMTAPVFVLDYLMKLDETKDYTAYTPGEAEKKMFAAYIKLLPPLNRRIINEKLAAVFFINNFRGSGLTDFVVDDKRNMYNILILNPVVLKKSFSGLLEWKERTCFKIDDPAYDISIDCGTGYTGLLYILLHETTHVVDYQERITPYIDMDMKKYFSIKDEETGFTKDTWSGISDTRKDYRFRGKVTFYGFNNGPLLAISGAAAVYTGRAGSPFVTLYAGLSWSEDLAELVTFYHYTQVMKKPFIIKLTREGKTVYREEPVKSAEIVKRFDQLKPFYR